MPCCRLNEPAIRCGRKTDAVSPCSRGRGDVVFPDLGCRLQKNLDLSDCTHVISVMNGGRAFELCFHRAPIVISRQSLAVPNRRELHALRLIHNCFPVRATLSALMRPLYKSARSRVPLDSATWSTWCDDWTWMIRDADDVDALPCARRTRMGGRR